MTSPIPVSASSKAKNRSPPISTRSGEPAAARAPYSSRRCRSDRSSRSTTGYCTSITRDPAVGRHRRSAGVEHVRQRRRAGTHAGQAALASGDAKVVPVVPRGQHQLHGEPGLGRRRRGEQLGRLLGVDARYREGVLELLPEGTGGRDHDHDQQQPGADDPPGMAYGQTTPAVQRVRHHGDSLEDPRYAGRSPTCPSSRRGAAATSAPGLVLTRPIDRRRGRPFGRCPATRLH